MGFGEGSAQVTLSQGQRYIIDVRAVKAAGVYIVASSDGFVVDATPPEISIVSVGAHTLNESTNDTLYQSDADSYNAAWAVSDSESGVSAVYYYIGTTPGKGLHIES